MKKINITLVILLALALVFTGCRGEGGEDTTAPPSVTASPTVTTSPETTAEGSTSVSETTECTHPDMITREIVPNCTEIYNIESYCHLCGYTKHEPQPPYGHRFVNNTCTICGISGEPEASEGLEFRQFSDYAVLVGIGTCKDSEVIIPATYNGLPVTEIWDRAFFEVKGMTSVTIPEGVTYIESEAFLNCPYLSEIFLPASLENVTGSLSIGFMNCPALKFIEVAEGNEKYFAKNNCLIEKSTGKLVLGGGKAEIPADGSVKSIGAHAFAGNLLLKSVNIPEGVTDIHTSAFEGCTNLASVTLPTTLKTIRQSAFKGCTALTSIVIPDSVTEIYNGAFSDCKNLKNVTLSKNLTLIDSEAFKGCAVENIVIPSGVTELGAAFAECEMLKAVTLPDGFERFVGHTFAGCTSLEVIDLPASLKYIGMYTFKDCTALKELRFGGSVAEWKWVATQERWNEGAAFESTKCSDGEVLAESISHDAAIELARQYWAPIKSGYFVRYATDEMYLLVRPDEAVEDRIYIDRYTCEISVPRLTYPDIPEVFLKVLLNETTYIPKFGFQPEGYFKDTILDYPSAEIGSYNYAVCDLDGDLDPELILSSLQYEIVLREFEGKVYGYLFDFRSFLNLKTNGNVDFTSNAGRTHGTARLSFDGVEVVWHDITRKEMGEDGSVTYFVDNEKATKEEFEAREVLLLGEKAVYEHLAIYPIRAYYPGG